MIIAVILSSILFASPSRAQNAPPTLSQLYDSFVSSVNRAEQIRLLDEISIMKPASSQDLADLFDLFARYSQGPAQDAAVAAINRMGPADYTFAPMVLNYITQPDPKTQFAGLLAELQLRDPKALPSVKKIAEKKFTVKAAANAPFLDEQDAWWTQYEALEVLASWQGKSALALLEKQAKDAPGVARIIAERFWVPGLPIFIRWANSRQQYLKDAAHEGLSDPMPPPITDLRQTRAAMLSLVLDPKQAPDLRHYLGLKVGLCSDDAQIAELISARAAAQDSQTKLYLLGAIYASRSPRAIPFLVNDVKANADPAARRGALTELKEIMPSADFGPLALWISKNDSDPGMRDFAQDEIPVSSGTAKPVSQ